MEVLLEKKFNKGNYATSDMGYVSSIKEIKKDLNEKPIVVNNKISNDDVPNQEILTNKKPMDKKKLTTMASAAVIAATGATANIDNEVPNKIIETKKEIVVPQKKPAYGDGEFINYIKKSRKRPIKIRTY